MALELYMVGLRVRDKAKSMEFYRRLGLAIPDIPEDEQFVPVKMHGGMTFFLDTRAFAREDSASNHGTDSYRVLLEFYLPSRAEVDAKYAALVELGGRSYRAPAAYPALKIYCALVDDLDGNTLMLTADMESGVQDGA